MCVCLCVLFSLDLTHSFGCLPTVVEHDNDNDDDDDDGDDNDEGPMIKRKLM